VVSQTVSACLPDPTAPTNQPRTIPNPDVLRDHTFYEFPIPEGEGYGPDGVNPYPFVFAAGDQSPNLPTGFAYALPNVTMVTPGNAPTRGGARMQIIGSNFGLYSPVTVYLGNAALGWRMCTSANRTSHFNIWCTVGEGVGRDLNVRVDVANQTGISATTPFSYAPPTVTTIIRTYDNLTAFRGGNVNDTTIVAIDINSTMSGVLRGDTAGGYNVTFIGTNFGPGGAGMCVFARSAGSVSAGQDLTCDGMESFLGEGEVAAASVAWWSHERVTFWMLPGVGQREVTLRVGMQAPVISYLNWRYNDPILRSITSPPIRCVQREGWGVGCAHAAHSSPPPPPLLHLQHGWRHVGHRRWMVHAAPVLERDGRVVPRPPAAEPHAVDANGGEWRARRPRRSTHHPRRTCYRGVCARSGSPSPSTACA